MRILHWKMRILQWKIWEVKLGVKGERETYFSLYMLVLFEFPFSSN